MNVSSVAKSPLNRPVSAAKPGQPLGDSVPGTVADVFSPNASDSGFHAYREAFKEASLPSQLQRHAETPGLIDASQFPLFVLVPAVWGLAKIEEALCGDQVTSRLGLQEAQHLGEIFERSSPAEQKKISADLVAHFEGKPNGLNGAVILDVPLWDGGLHCTYPTHDMSVEAEAILRAQSVA